MLEHILRAFCALYNFLFSFPSKQKSKTFLFNQNAEAAPFFPCHPKPIMAERSLSQGSVLLEAFSC